VTLAASIDLGTNTFRLLIADISPAGNLAPLRTERIITRLGEGFHRNGLINEEACRRSIEALQGLLGIVASYPVERLYTAATSVVREAVNGRDFLDRVREQTGVRIRVLSGSDEARLSHAGVVSTIAAPPRCLVIDIGGGSTELVLSGNGLPLRTASIPLGVVHLAEQMISTDPPESEELRSLNTAIRNCLAARIPRDFIREPAPSAPFSTAPPLVGTAGSITTLAAIDQGMTCYDPAHINGYRFSRARAATIYARLAATPRDERTSIPGMEHGREDLIIPGAAILLQLMEYLQAESLTVSDGGLLEGILIDAHRSHQLG